MSLVSTDWLEAKFEKCKNIRCFLAYAKYK